jgi:hypothetical protein
VLSKYIKKVNCNADAPQNHNLLITNLRSNSAKALHKGEIKVVDKKEALNVFIDQKKKELVSLHDGKAREVLPPDKLVNIKTTIEEKNSSVLKKQPQHIERLLYEFAPMIRSTLKQAVKGAKPV